MASTIKTLLNTLQPNSVVFGGSGLSPSPLRWDNTESGLPVYPLWSTGCNSGGGDPDSTEWCPAGCDTTLQDGDHWFWMPNTGIRSLSDLINVYHSTVGQNGVLELDFAIDRTGRVDPTHAQRYSELGQWIRNCYNSPIDSASGNGTSFILTFSQSLKVDRVVIQEDQNYGQRIRAYQVETSTTIGGSWSSFSNGTSIGNKKIDIVKSVISVIQFRLTITQAIAPPVIAFFGAYAPCSTS